MSENKKKKLSILRSIFLLLLLYRFACVVWFSHSPPLWLFSSFLSSLSLYSLLCCFLILVYFIVVTYYRLLYWFGHQADWTIAGITSIPVNSCAIRTPAITRKYSIMKSWFSFEKCTKKIYSLIIPMKNRPKLLTSALEWRRKNQTNTHMHTWFCEVRISALEFLCFFFCTFYNFCMDFSYHWYSSR